MNSADCLRYLEQLTLLRGRYPDTWHNYAVLLAECGHVEEALTAVSRAIELHPQYLDALFTRVFLLGELGRENEAFPLLRRLHVRSPDDFATVAGVGVFFLRHKWFDAGIEQLLRAERMRPGLPFVLLHVAAALAGAGREEEAMSRLEKARSIVASLEEPRMLEAFPASLTEVVTRHDWRNPFQVKAHIIRSNFAVGEGDLVTAQAELWEANARYPGHPLVVWHLAKILTSLGRVTDAKRWLYSAVAMDPENHLAHYELSWAHAENGDLEQAVRALRKAAALRPLFPDYHYTLGTALMDLSRFEEAIEAFRRVAKIHPDYGHNEICLANAYLETHQPGLALAALASSHAADWPEALAVAARAHLLNGDPFRARAAAEKALARDPGFREARDILSALHIEVASTQQG